MELIPVVDPVECGRSTLWLLSPGAWHRLGRQGYWWERNQRAMKGQTRALVIIRGRREERRKVTMGRSVQRGFGKEEMLE